MLFKEEVFAIIGCAFSVYNELGNGFLESVYQEAMEWELTSRNIPFISQQRINIIYKNTVLKKEFIADMVCYGEIILELKAVDAMTSVEESQILNYLKATGKPLGLLLNFGARKNLEWKRFARDR